MGFLKKTRKRIGKGIKDIKLPFKKKGRKKKEKRKKGFLLFPCNTCCCVGLVILLGIGMIAFGGNVFDMFPTIDEEGFIIPPRVWAPPDVDEGDDSYYQLGLEFPVQPEDIDVLLTVGFYQFDEVTWIEDIDLEPIGLLVSVNDYKPGDTFFLDMFYGDADYNITMSGVITVNEAIQMTVYVCNVAAVELLDITWIEDGSGVRWDYP